MRCPGDPIGPMGLPASYSKAQLEYFGWNGTEFTHVQAGGWGSKLNESRWQDQEPRLRKKEGESHF